MPVLLYTAPRLANTYSPHISRARSRCFAVDCATLGFMRLFASVLGAWLVNTLAELSFAAALRREKNDFLGAFLSDDDDETTVVGIVGTVVENGGKGSREGTRREEGTRERGEGDR